MNVDENLRKQPFTLMVVVGVLLIILVIGASFFLNSEKNSRKYSDLSLTGTFETSQLIIDSKGIRHIINYQLRLSGNDYAMIITSDDMALSSRGNLRLDSKSLRLDVVAGELTADLNTLDQDLLYRLLRIKTPHNVLRLTEKKGCWELEDVFAILCQE